MKPISKQPWIPWANLIFLTQLVLLALIRVTLSEIPYWVMLPYLPFVKVCMALTGWAGLLSGVLLGALVYSYAGGIIVTWILKKLRAP